MNLDFNYMIQVFLMIIKFVPLTLYMAVLSMIFAIILALVMAFIKNNRVPVLHQLVTCYISFFRAMPTLVELFLIYYGFPQMFPAFKSMDAMTAAIIGLSLKEAAYLAEIFRAALNSVDKGQLEACLGVGISKIHAYIRIILPQAARNALPATGNTFISLLKETSLAFTLGVAELFAQGKMMAADSLDYFDTYLVVAFVYWLLIVAFSLIQRLLEQRLDRAYNT